MKALRAGEDSSIQRMIRLVQSADAGKAKIVGLADRWATWIVIIALSAAALTWLISGELLRAVTILVVFCPCALVLATPTAIMAAIGNATRHGFLVREGDALERLAAVSRIAFDKTGTLTCGTPEVTAVRSFAGEYPEKWYTPVQPPRSFGQSIPWEKRWSAVSGRKLRRPSRRNFRCFRAVGVRALVEGREILAGNRELLEDSQGFSPKPRKARRKNFWPSDVRLFIRRLTEKRQGSWLCRTP